MRIRASFFGAVTALLLTAGGTAAPAFAAGSGQIDGTITDSSGAPVSTCVSVYDTTYSYAGSACTDETGAYTVDGLTDGTAYRVDVAGDGVHAEQWFNQASTFDGATDVVAPGTANVTLAPASVIRGVLTAQDGTAVDGASVSVYDTAYNYVAGSSTDPDGAWSVSVPAGDYKVEFTNWPADMWFRQAFSFDTADVVSVGAGATSSADAQLVAQGSVTGKVTDALTGAPLANVCAQVVDPATFESTQNGVGYGCTDDSGVYHATVSTPGTYTVQFIDGNGRYVGVYAGDTRKIASARTVRVGATGEVRRDQKMRVGAVITGRAVDSRTHQPIADISGSLFSGPVKPDAGVYPYVWGVGGSTSGTDGVYTLTGVPTGTYTLQLTPGYRSGYAQQWYAGATSQAGATKVTTHAPTTTKLIAAKFVPGGTVSGTVTDSAGHPIAGAWVDLDGYYPGRAGPGEGQNTAQTDAAGHYSLVAPAGTYPALAYDYEGDYASSWVGGAVTRAASGRLAVKPTTSVTQDFVLRPGAHISGTAVNADGSTPAANIYVVGQIYTTSGDYIGDLDAFQSNGFAFTSNALPAGRFVIRTDIVDQDTGQVTQTIWYDGATTRAGATVVPLTRGATKTITLHLP